MTTVGYGDINAGRDNDSEIMIAIFAMLVGATVFGYVIGNVTSMIENMDPQQVLYKHKINFAKAFIRDRNFPRDISVRLRKHFEYYYNHKTVFDDTEIVEIMDPVRNMVIWGHL